MPATSFALVFAMTAGPAPGADRVQEIFDDACTICHDDSGDPGDPEGLNLEVEPGALLGLKSAVNGEPLIVPGDPNASYLMKKMLGSPGIAGEMMPEDEPLPEEDLKAVHDWIASLPKEQGGAAAAPAETGGEPGTGTAAATVGTDSGGASDPAPDGTDAPLAVKKRLRKPFNGTHQGVLPTTTSLGKRNFEFRIHHRFGQIGAERGAFGMDVGAIISFGLSYGIIDGLDVLLRRSNSLKNYELGVKYVPLRQEAGMPLSLGFYGSVDWFRDFPENISNPWAGNLMLMASRLWFERWSTMLTFGYHFRTNHDPVVFVDLGSGPQEVTDKRDTITLGLASTVWVDKRKRWGIDLEWLLPIPDGGSPNLFHYNGGDADPDGTRIGAWTLGASYRIGLHFFQILFTNTREIQTNLAANGGQTGNPFEDRGNFFLGFNLSRKFKL